MIEDEGQLRYSIELLSRHYALADKIRVQEVGDAGTRDDEIEGVECMRLKIEREVAEFLAKKYGYVRAEDVKAEEQAQEAAPAESREMAKAA